MFFLQGLQPASPANLPDNTGQIEIRTDSGMDAGAGEKLDRVVPVYWQRKRAAQPRIILSVIFTNIVYCCAAAVIIG